MKYARDTQLSIDRVAQSPVRSVLSNRILHKRVIWLTLLQMADIRNTANWQIQLILDMFREFARLKLIKISIVRILPKSLELIITVIMKNKLYLKSVYNLFY